MTYHVNGIPFEAASPRWAARKYARKFPSLDTRKVHVTWGTCGHAHFIVSATVNVKENHDYPVTD